MEQHQAQEARQWATACHLAALTGFITAIGFVIGPLIVWVLKKDEHPLIDDQGKESMNFQISMLIYALLLVPSVILVVGIPLLIAWGIVWFVFVLIAAVRASDGKRFRYPLTIRFVR